MNFHETKTDSENRLVMGVGALRLSREGWTGSLGLADENCYI